MARALIAIGLSAALAGCVATKTVPVVEIRHDKQEIPAALLDCGQEPRPASMDDRGLANQLAGVTIWGRGCADKLGQVKGLVETTP